MSNECCEQRKTWSVPDSLSLILPDSSQLIPIIELGISIY